MSVNAQLLSQQGTTRIFRLGAHYACCSIAAGMGW